MSLDILDMALSALDATASDEAPRDPWRSLGSVVGQLVEDARREQAVGNMPVAAPSEVSDRNERETLGDLRRKIEQQCAEDSARAAWSREWFEEFDSDQVRACRLLWGEVLRRCILDILADRVIRLRQVRDQAQRTFRRVGDLDVRAAGAWAFGRDFHMVAELAGFDGNAIADRLRPVLDDLQQCLDMQELLRGHGIAVRARADVGQGGE